jgi:hydroxyethylthiazole kinase-like uncharacterized protein yjeF
MLLVLAQIGAADAGVGKAQLDRPALDVAGKRGVVEAGTGIGGGHRSIVDVGHAYNSGCPIPFTVEISTPSSSCACWSARRLPRWRFPVRTDASRGQRRLEQPSTALAEARRISIYCGPGNNGGDGFLLGVLAREAGLQVQIIALSDASHGDAALARAAWEADDGQVHRWSSDDTALPAADVQVDALYGIGLNRALESSIATLIECINAMDTPVLALDVPSGINADSGRQLGAAVRADVTVTFIANKRGLHTGQSADYAGLLEVATLGVPEDVYAAARPMRSCWQWIRCRRVLAMPIKATTVTCW